MTIPTCNHLTVRRQALMSILLAAGFSIPFCVNAREDIASERIPQTSYRTKPAPAVRISKEQVINKPDAPVRPTPSERATDQHSRNSGAERDRSRHSPRPAHSSHYSSRHWRLDGRHHHNRYYPARGYVIGYLPAGYITVDYHGVRYYHHAGVWFRPRGLRYVVVAPPFGVVIPFLPTGYSTLWLRGSPYYYADEVYYVRTAGGYQVVEPPPADEIDEVTVQHISSEAAPAESALPPSPAGSSTQPAAPVARPLFAYPKNGQTQTQTSFDRIECHRWAIAQTGFDPSQSTGDEDKHANFQRAATACLEGRGYSVK